MTPVGAARAGVRARPGDSSRDAAHADGPVRETGSRPRMVLPTERLAAVVAGAALVGLLVGGLASGGLAWALTVGAAAVLLPGAVIDGWSLVRAATPRITLGGPDHGSLRRAFPVTVRGLDGGGARIRSATVRCPWEAGGPVRPRRLSAGDGEVTWWVTPRRRGPLEVGPVWVFREGPLGLIRQRVVDPATHQVRVGPDLRGPADDVLGREGREVGDHASVRGLAEAGSELRGLRPFAVGDDPRHVDWRATARVGEPVVREWDPDRRRTVIVGLDAGRLMRAEHDGESKLDAALRAVERLALAAEARGDGVGVVAYADGPLRWAPPTPGPGQARRLRRMLEDLTPQSTEAALWRVVPHLGAHQTRRALVVVVTDVADRAGADALLRGVGGIAARHLPVVALLRDPHLDEALAAPVADEDDAWRRAAAEIAIQDRLEGLRALRARGVAAFDVSMRSVASEVVGAYASAKGRAAW